MRGMRGSGCEHLDPSRGPFTGGETQKAAWLEGREADGDRVGGRSA